MDERCIVLDTLAKKIEIAEYIECPILKSEIETLKGQLKHVAILSNTFSISSS